MADEGTKFWYLENFNIFKDLKDESMQELSRITSMQDIPKNQPIYFPQEPSNSIFFLKKGRVKLTRTSNDGKEMILALVNKGEVFGEMAYFDEGERNDLLLPWMIAWFAPLIKMNLKSLLIEIPN
jgi:CRP/FNR family transcriptional regulator